MIKPRTITVEHIEHEEIIMAVTMTKLIITTVTLSIIIIIMMITRIKIDNRIKIWKKK